MTEKEDPSRIPSFNGTQKLMTALVALGMFMLALYMAIVPGLNQRIDHEKEYSAEAIRVLRERVATLSAMSDRLARAEQSIKHHEGRFNRAESWREEHDLRIPGTDSAQWSRIYGLEREVFGDPLPRKRE